MKMFMILSLLCWQCIYGDQPLEKYFSYVKELAQSNGNYREGEIEIVLDPVDISRIQKIQEDRLIKKGFSKDTATEFSRVGIISEDQYWIWLRDAVYFPQGIPGTYDRLLGKNQLKSKSPGVAILPILPSGQIVLIVNYRHATRSWELELPRGAIELRETFEEAALRELKEETGFTASSLNFLGEIALDSGTLSSVMPVFIGKIATQEQSCTEYSEAIASTILFTKDELKAGLIKGFLEVSLEGKRKQIPLRDAFLTFALLQAEIRGFL